MSEHGNSDKSSGAAVEGSIPNVGHFDLEQAVAQLTTFYPPNPHKHGRMTDLYENAAGVTVKQCTTLEGQGVTPELWKRHLLGRPGFLALGFLPGDDTGTRAGMIDLDVKDYPEPGSLEDALHRLYDVCRAHGVHCYPETSTRGGRHVHIFSDTVIPHRTMSAALRVLCSEAGLAKTEPYPAGDGPLSTWYLMPYAGAARDGLGRTQLTTDAGQIIPVIELDEWLELTPADILTDLAEQYTPTAETVTDAPADDLKPEAVTAICEAVQNPPQGTFDRHGSLAAFIHLGRRCGRLSEVVRTLKSETVRATWAGDGSRDADEWIKEIDRWVRATGTRQRGIKFLLEQGFSLGHLPSVEDDDSAAEGFVSFVKSFLGETSEKNNSTEEEETAWEGMLELPPTAPEVRTLPADLIPEPFRAWIDDAAERACVHREFIAIPALVSAGALIGRSVALYPKRFDGGWKVVANLWGAIVGPPSVLKTMAIDEGTLHLRRLAVDARKDFEDKEADREAEIEILKLELANLKKSAGGKKGNPASIRADLTRVMRELKEKEEADAEKRYLTNDATIEKLGELLRENPRGLLMVRDELVGFLKTLEKPGRENERPFYLEAWNGTGSHNIDRIGRGSLFVPALTLGILGGIQPGKLMSYIDGALEGESEADGLLQRFQLLVWPDRPPEWVNVDRYPNTTAKNRAYDIYKGLDALDLTKLGLDAQEEDIPGLHFDDDAQELFDGWRDELMHQIRAPEIDRTPAYQSHLAKYPSLFASLALVFHLIDVADNKATGRVSFTAAELALQWCAYLEDHAKKVYAPELNTTAFSTHALAEKIKAGEVDDSTPLRDIYRRQWTGLKNPEQVGNAIAALEHCKWVRSETAEPGKKGGRPSEVLRLHPELRGA
jgi:putative DNA primase/helicase